MRKRLAWLLLAACGPFAHAGNPGVASVEDDDIAFLLSNFHVIKEVRDVGPIGFLRLVMVPERDDKCSWKSKIPNLSSAHREDGCPRRNLYLMLSEPWEEFDKYDSVDQRAYHIGLAMFWGFVGLEITEGKRSVILRLEADRIVNGKMKHQSVAIEISNGRGGGRGVRGWSVSRTDSP